MSWVDARYVAFDLETSGTAPEYALQPWRVAQGKAWITSISEVSRIDGKFRIDGGLDPTVEDLRDFLEAAIAAGQTIVGWNVAFDISWLLAAGLEELVFKARWLDGMLLWRHKTIEPEYGTVGLRRKSYGLKNYVKEFVPAMAGYEHNIDFHDTSPEARARLQKYNDQDTIATFLGAKHMWGLLNERQQQAASIEAECLPMIAKANLDGMLVDTLVSRELDAYLTNLAQRQLEILSPHGVTEQVVRSPVQLAKLMYDVWGLKPFKYNTSAKTDKTTRSTDKEALYELSFSDPRAMELRTYREALNQRKKFAEALLVSAHYNEDGKTHPLAIPFGTYSGRLTYASSQGRKKKERRQIGFALHQQKRDKMFRDQILPPPGYALVEFDAAGQEFRWMAIASKDPVMLGLCAPGEDPHSYMGAEISGQPYAELLAFVRVNDTKAKGLRQLGKVANLSLQYRTSAAKLRSVARVQYSLPMEIKEAKDIHGTYQRVYTEVPKFWKNQIQSTRNKGYVETFAGRRVQVQGNWEGSKEWSMGSTAINYRIQGTGADQKYLALAVLRPYLTEIGAYFAWDLHDGIYLYVPLAKVDQAVMVIKSRLDNLPYKRVWGFEPPITLPWDAKVGASWGSLKSYGESSA